MQLQSKKIVLGITGGIAAYKAAELARALVKEGAAVQVIMSPAATQFVTPLTLQALSGQPVFVDAWDSRIANHMPHIELSRGADCIVVAPATTDFMSKVALGQGNDLLSNLCLAREHTCPLILAPAMNRQMWQHPATQRHVAQLKADGVQLWGPAAGEQACGEVGDGRMLEPLEIVDDLIAFFQPKVLAGKRVVITAGPTFEAIDPVRGITNLSSGKMGYALAQAAQQAGAEVILISGPTALQAPRGVLVRPVQSAAQMLVAVQSNMQSAAQKNADVFISVAAVADWRVKNASAQKIKKNKDTSPTLEFEANPDILATIARDYPHTFCVGFAAETENLESYARAKLAAKKIPLIIANLAQAALGADSNEAWLIDADHTVKLPHVAKLALARQICAEISTRLNTQK